MIKLIALIFLNIYTVVHAETFMSNSNVQINSVNIGVEGDSNTGALVVDGIDISNNKIKTQRNVMGSGRESTITRKINDFNVLISKLSADIHVRLGRPAKLTISGDDNLIPLVNTELNDGVLQITVDKGYVTKTALLITIDVPEIKMVRLGGSGEIRLFDVNSEKLKLILEGAGDIQASGKVISLEVEINGSGDLDLSDLITVNSQIAISGAGDAELNITGVLDVVIEGSGDVVYSGSPKKILTKINGSGEVMAH